jgi:uncharacterized protein (TIGR03437 family)
MVWAVSGLTPVALWGAAPSYSAATIVNSGSFAPGALAPNTLITIFGTDLSFSRAAANLEAVSSGFLPTELAGVRVLVASTPAPLFYVDDKQINLLVPSYLRPGDTKLVVLRQSIAGPEVAITIGESAPALFRAGDFAIATHADSSVITADSPAHPGEIVVIYATGLGAVTQELPINSAPQTALPIRRLADFRLLLDGVAVDPANIFYVGITPRSRGLYQINVALPESTGVDPEIRIAIADQSSPADLKLPVR